MRRATRQRGASLTEFAITVPLFVALIYGSLYLTDVGTFKLKAQEISRYGTWAFTQRHLSDFEGEPFNHSEKFTCARDGVIDELEDVYFDLDGARTRTLPIPGARSKTQRAFYEPPPPAQVTNRPVQMVPSWANASFAEPLSSLWWVLQMLGIGADANSIVSGPFGDMRFNTKGQVASRATVRLAPLVRPQDWQQQVAMARAGAERGADLSRWNPAQRAFKNSDGSNIELILVADPWRTSQGWSAHPQNAGDRSKTHFQNAVAEVSDEAITALPGGTIINALLQPMGYIRDFPGGEFGLIFRGVPPDEPKAHVFSRPYSDKQGRETDRHPWQEPARRLTGQADIFEETGVSDLQEDGAVRRFETGPLYLDAEPSAARESPYLKNLLERGPNFMGCGENQTRGCWE